VKRYGQCGRKASWNVKWYGKYGKYRQNCEMIWKRRRKESRIVIRYGKYGRKISRIVKWFGKYGRKVSRIVIRYG
jgi:hypothetical protein